MTPTDFDLRCTAEHWGAEGAWQTGRGRYWLELPAVQTRLNEKATGQRAVDWIRYTLDQHFDRRLPLARCFSLGCGEGGLERELAGLGAFTTCDAIDIAPVSIAKAQLLAQEAGYAHIRYAVQDANCIELPHSQYDAAWSSGALHHVERLEHVCAQIAASLKPDGLFILNEYVGPSRFQFAARQRQIIQACLNLLPEVYRGIIPAARAADGPPRRDLRRATRRLADKLRDGTLPSSIMARVRNTMRARSGRPPIKATANLPTVQAVTAVDPSEAIRSADILFVLRQWFEIVEQKPLGGAILQFLLADIAGNFAHAGGAPLLETLFMIEDVLMAAGDLDSDFTYIVAAPKRLA